MRRRKVKEKRVYKRGNLLDRMLAHRIIVLTAARPDPQNACWAWRGAHSKKVRKGKTVGPPRPVVWLGPDQDSPVLPVARVALSYYDGVPLSERGDMEAGHVVCANSWCWNPRHLAWRTKEENREDRIKQYGHLWGRRREI